MPFKVRQEFVINTSYKFEDFNTQSFLFSSKEEEGIMLNFLSYLTSISLRELTSDFFYLVTRGGASSRLAKGTFLSNYFIEYRFAKYKSELIDEFLKNTLSSQLRDLEFSGLSCSFVLRKYALSNSGDFNSFYLFLEEYFCKLFVFLLGQKNEQPSFFYLSLLNTIVDECKDKEAFGLYLKSFEVELSFMTIDKYIDFVVDSYFIFPSKNGKIFIENGRFVFDEISSTPFYENGFLSPSTREEIKRVLIPFFQEYQYNKNKTKEFK